MTEADESDSGYWSEPAPPKSAGLFSKSADDVHLAVDARKLLAAAASNCSENKSKVTQLRFIAEEEACLSRRSLPFGVNLLRLVHVRSVITRYGFNIHSVWD